MSIKDKNYRDERMKVTRNYKKMHISSCRKTLKNIVTWQEKLECVQADMATFVDKAWEERELWDRGIHPHYMWSSDELAYHCGDDIKLPRNLI